MSFPKYDAQAFLATLVHKENQCLFVHATRKVDIKIACTNTDSLMCHHEID